MKLNLAIQIYGQTIYFANKMRWFHLSAAFVHGMQAPFFRNVRLLP